MDTRVASRYAQALFDVASKQNIVQSVSDDLNGLTATLTREANFREFMANPANNRDNKLKLIEGVFSDRITALTMHLVRLLLDKRRENLLPAVAASFETLRRESSNTLFAEITSAMPLSEPERKSLTAKLESQSKKKVEASYAVDPSLLGGVMVQLGDYVLDGTVRGSLNRLKDKLLYDVLKQN